VKQFRGAKIFGLERIGGENSNVRAVTSSSEARSASSRGANRVAGSGENDPPRREVGALTNSVLSHVMHQKGKASAARKASLIKKRQRGRSAVPENGSEKQPWGRLQDETKTAEKK